MAIVYCFCHCQCRNESSGDQPRHQYHRPGSLRMYRNRQMKGTTEVLDGDCRESSLPFTYNRRPRRPLHLRTFRRSPEGLTALRRPRLRPGSCSNRTPITPVAVPRHAVTGGLVTNFDGIRWQSGATRTDRKDGDAGNGQKPPAPHSHHLLRPERFRPSRPLDGSKPRSKDMHDQSREMDV